MKPADMLSERMVFGTIIIVGLVVLIHELLYNAPHLKPEVISLIAGGVGALSTAMGLIVQSVFKTDKIDKLNAETAAAVAAKAPDQSGATA